VISCVLPRLFPSATLREFPKMTESVDGVVVVEKLDDPDVLSHPVELKSAAPPALAVLDTSITHDRLRNPRTAGD
jgi:hypothetical protein